MNLKLKHFGAIAISALVLTSCSHESAKIGDQEWMTQNLNVTTFRDGSTIPEAKSDEEWAKAGEEKKPAWCYYSADKEDEKEIGKIYNWYAVNDPRGIAPEGWRIATNEDWEKLISFAGAETAAIKLKSKDGWKWEGFTSDQNVNNNATNETGFSALPGGGRGPKYALGNLSGWWWSATEVDADKAYYFHMTPNEAGVEDGNEAKGGNEVEKLEYEKWAGMRVRCIKNDITKN